LKNNHTTNDTPAQYEEEIKCMKERLTRCLQLLKKNNDKQISKTAFKLIENDHSGETPYGSWIIALNAIAGSCILSQRELSQSEIYDFLTLAFTTTIQDRTKTIDDTVFRIYKDIMTRYESSDEKLKIAYPKIIVDSVAVLAKGEDASGKKIPIHNVEYYYQMRKSDAMSASVSAASDVPFVETAIVTTTASAASIKSIGRDMKVEEPTIQKDEESELIDILNRITDRSKKDIQTSIAKLEGRDVMRLKDLCKNYSKIQKYSKLIADADNLQKFKAALQSESGRRLSEHQVQHAASSIKKAKLYVENVLDGKFTPHGSYGINHTKHNLEYGYLIVGLMQPSRKRTGTRGEKP
jgi:hypothetical protein